MSADGADVTHLLAAWTRGDARALEALVPLLYAELRRIAERQLDRERPDHTLQPTALVHEAFLRLVDQQSVAWQGRAHFFGVAARLMRNVLVDHARGRGAQKRGGDVTRVAFDEALLERVAADPAAEVLALDDALVEMATFDERKSRIVELRFFGGLSIEETAEVLGVSPGTVMRDWTLAKAWLSRQLREGG